MMLTGLHVPTIWDYESRVLDWHCKGTEQSFELLLVSVKCGDEMSREAS